MPTGRSLTVAELADALAPVRTLPFGSERDGQ